MQRENQKDRTILCKFDPTEPGDYRVEVKWAGEHVPGSPFMVMIFDTQEELNRFLQVKKKKIIKSKNRLFFPIIVINYYIFIFIFFIVILTFQGNHSPAGSDLYSSVNYSSSYAHITP